MNLNSDEYGRFSLKHMFLDYEFNDMDLEMQYNCLV